MMTSCLGLVALLALCVLPMVGGAAAVAADDKPIVVLDTSMGPITLELDRAKAPITVDNFLKYVDEGFYDGTIFHRVIEKLDDGRPFMIQGGGMTADMREKEVTHPPIKNEGLNGLKNLRGTIVMARTNDPDSATAQFFINLGDTAFLDSSPRRPGYAVFGRVIEGMDTVDKIAKVETGTRGPHENVPTKPIIIKSAKRKAKS